MRTQQIATGNTEDLREKVRDHYARYAIGWQGSESSCCSTSSCCTPEQAIPVTALAALGEDGGIPLDVIQTSLGCGTPLELAALQQGETVLDLGSGGGLDCFFAARLVGPNGRVIGVDMTPEMLALARANQHRLGIANVEFRQGFMEALPLEDASVDVVISNCVINLSPDKDAVFREAFRVLKPHGRVAFSDIVSRYEIPPGLRKNLQSWAECISGAITPELYIDKMRRAGFQDIRFIAQPEANDLVYSAKFLASKP